MRTPSAQQSFGLAIIMALLIFVVYQSWLVVRHQHRPRRIAVAEQLYEGVNYVRMVRETPRPLVIHIIEIDLTHPDIEFLVTPSNLHREMEMTARTTSHFLREFNVQLAINGSFFEPFRVGTIPWDYYPKSGDPVDVNGLAISDSVLYSDVHEKDTNLCISDDGVQLLQSDCPPGTKQALAGNARLLWNGQVDSFSNNKLHPRTAVALDDRAETLWLIVIDGRQDGYSEGVTLAELAGISAELGADVAINLDGGGSSTLVMMGDTGVQVLNAPIHQNVPMWERPVANHLGVYASEQSIQ